MLNLRSFRITSSSICGSRLLIWTCLLTVSILYSWPRQINAEALAPVISNGSFENDSAGNGKTSLSGWTVSSGSVDVLNGSTLPSGAAAGSKFLDLANGTIEQTISGFSINQPYVLRIDYRGNPSDQALKDAKVIIDGQEMRQGLFGGDLPGIHSKEENNWVVCNGFEFHPSSSSVTIKIDSEESGSNGLLIDNIRILDGKHSQPPEHDFSSLPIDSDGWRPLVNGGFESTITTYSSDPENTGPDDNNPHLCGNALPGWRVTRENIDRINGWPNTPDGSKVIDVGGHGPGSIAQTIIGLVPNSSYQLEFYAARHRFWGTDTMTTEVWSNGQLARAFSRNSNQTANSGYIREELNLTSSSSGEITFEIFSTNIDKGGNNVMDNFRIKGEEPINQVPDDWLFRNNTGAYVPNSETQIQVSGTGTNWNAQFWRKDGSAIDSGNRVSFDFYVDAKMSKALLSLRREVGNDERIALFDNQGDLQLQIYRPNEAAPAVYETLLSSSEFIANTWYSASITVDDQYGFLVEVEQRDNPAINGSYRDSNRLLSTGQQWSFFGLIRQNSVFVDNYLEEEVTLTPPPADDWTFLNETGSYIPGSDSQIQVSGTGSNWNAQFWRKSDSPFGSGNRVSFDFYVDGKTSKTLLTVRQTDGGNERIGLFDNRGDLQLQIYRPNQPNTVMYYTLLSDTEFHANTWYSSSFTIDDEYGLLVEVEQRDNAAISGSYRDSNGLLNTGQQWEFFGLIRQNSVFVDNYLEEEVTLTPPPADDWTFLNETGSYVPGSTAQIQSTGTGANWNAQFFRKDGSTFGTGNKVSFDFNVDTLSSNAHLGILKDGGNKERVSIVENGNGLQVKVQRPGQSPAVVTASLIDEAQVQANTWYRGSITIDDANGFIIEVEQRDDPSINGSYTDTAGLLTVGNQWKFSGLIRVHTVYLENYQEELFP